MFLWGAPVFHLELFTHLPGFVVMTAATSFDGGVVRHCCCHHFAQPWTAGRPLDAADFDHVGHWRQHVPAFLMPDAMKTAGLFTFNAWAIDGYTKVFWRDEPVSHLAPQVAVLIGSGMVLFLIARRFARVGIPVAPMWAGWHPARRLVTAAVRPAKRGIGPTANGPRIGRISASRPQPAPAVSRIRA